MPIGPSDPELGNVINQIVSDMRESHPDGAPRESGVIEVGDSVTRENFATFPRAAGADMVAVDGGSSAILDAGSFIVAGVRVGSVRYSDREFGGLSGPDMHLLYLSASGLEDAYSIFFGKTVGGEPPDFPRGLDEAVGRIRTLMEWKHLEDVLAGDIAQGELLAFDGALWAGIKGLGEMLERIVASAREKGVILCGISKRSMLTHRSRPLIPVVQMAGDSAFPASAWHYPVDVGRYGDRMHGEVHVAKLHPHSGYAFRVDLSLPPGTGPRDALAKLAYHCNDPTYAGYPYPLARAHNEVAFSRSDVQDIRGMLRSGALGAGMDPAEWQLTFQNFHDVLDMNR